MIYSRFGCVIEITHNCSHGLVRAIRKDDGEVRFYAPFTLRADGGFDEIDAAMKAAPDLTLQGAELKRAIRQVE